ncbi:uncharacterized protein LOC136025126 [Artemia franciscana]|uniref:uncharacterized protein LOC136025126 n=1 Tax=Artemia franciscana TaxID=6661 RepID=UPI0032DBF27E
MKHFWIFCFLIFVIITPSFNVSAEETCKLAKEQGWMKYDCKAEGSLVTSKIESNATNVYISNARNVTVNLSDLPNLAVVKISNSSLVQLYFSSSTATNISRIQVLKSETVIVNVKKLPALDTLKITDAKYTDIIFPIAIRVIILHNVQLKTMPDYPRRALEILDLSENPISNIDRLDDMPVLTFLSLANTNLKKLPILNLPMLDKLILDGINLEEMSSDIFLSTPNLKEIYVSEMPRLHKLSDRVFTPLSKLDKLVLTQNKKLVSLQGVFFPYSLKFLNISENSLKYIPKSLIKAKLEYFLAHGNNLVCDCGHLWLHHWNRSNLECGEGKYSGLHLNEAMPLENCSKVELQNSTSLSSVFIYDRVILRCTFRGNPAPSITWITPYNTVYKWSSEVLMDENMTQALETGELLIPRVERKDVGRYTCTGSNAVSDFTTYVTLKMNPRTIHETKVFSVVAGLATCVAFMIIVVTVLLVKMLVERCGWQCCCKKQESPQAKRIKTMLDSLEQYRSQQLERLRESYHQQVNRVKENCALQAEKVRDTYQHQAQNVRDLRSYGTQHFTVMKDQYSEQMRKLNDYSTDRLQRVRTNYLTQRDRISRFSAQQLLRLRESAKYQQRTLNKIIENLPSLYLDNCRTGGPGIRTDSIYFEDDLTEADMYIKTTISKLSLELEIFNCEAIPLDRIAEETHEQQIDDTKAAIKPPHSRQGSGTSMDLSKFLPTRLTTAATNARRNRKRKRTRNQQNVCATVELEVQQSLLPQPGDVVETDSDKVEDSQFKLEATVLPTELMNNAELKHENKLSNMQTEEELETVLVVNSNQEVQPDLL